MRVSTARVAVTLYSLLSCIGCDRNGDKNKAESSSDTGTDAGTDSGTDFEMTDTATATEPAEELVVRLSTSDGLPVSDFQVIASFPNQGIREIWCGPDASDADENIRCVDLGVAISGFPEVFNLVVKMRGYHFSSQTVDVMALDEVDGQRLYPLTLSRLPDFTVDDDYVTGFDSDGLERFKSMAYKTDTELGPSYSVKFYIDGLDTTPTVYFQNTQKNPIHYEFVRNVLGKSMTATEFSIATYLGETRSAMAGTVMLYDAVHSRSERLGQDIAAPLVLTFFPSDDLTPLQALEAHRLIEERIGFSPLVGDTLRFFYLPAGSEQEAVLATQTDPFAQWGALWVLRSELFDQISLQIMNQGLAYGTLRIAEEADLTGVVLSFRDILVLPRLPVALPIVGGTITDEMQTPLCHVNIMAKNRGTPNISLRDASSDPAITGLIGKLVRFEVTEGAYTLVETTVEEAEAFWQSEEKEPIVLEADPASDGLPLFEELGFGDSVRVGAKAANLAELHQLLGDKAPTGFAVPFFYYDRYMGSNTVSLTMCDSAHSFCLEEARSLDICDRALDMCASLAEAALWDYVNGLLASSDFNTDTELREAALAGVRSHIYSGTVDAAFAQALDQRVAEVFGASRVRLRSSTNAEDLPGFSGAGLYDSVSAYAEGEEIASKVIRMVWASVWNWRAFEERSFWHIDHLSTYMGVAINQAFVDELANGVLITQNIADRSVTGMYVNAQLGEVSVTNPTGGATPEIFSIISGIAGSTQVARLCYSSLCPNAPIMSDAEIRELYETAATVQDHFANLYGENPDFFALDLEFKLEGANRQLAIKQARPYTD